MTMLLIIIAIVVALIALPLVMAWKSHNRLMALDARCDTAFSDIDVHLKHRHNLIPGLVETVRAYATHERDILLGITQARADALAATTPEMKLKAEKNLTQNITSLLAMADRFPDLKASAHFRELRQDLTDCENRITASRRFHNLTVEEYNVSLRQFPGSVVGNYRRLSSRRPFDLGIERMIFDEPVTVKF
jgi:LemA protein